MQQEDGDPSLALALALLCVLFVSLRLGESCRKGCCQNGDHWRAPARYICNTASCCFGCTVSVGVDYMDASSGTRRNKSSHDRMQCRQSLAAVVLLDVCVRLSEHADECTRIHLFAQGTKQPGLTAPNAGHLAQKNTHWLMHKQLHALRRTRRSSLCWQRHAL